MTILTLLAEFELFKRNLHCKQIFLACTGDNSYGSLLRGYTQSSGKSERITLIEALPFAHEIRLLSDKFEAVKFDDLFRTTKLTVNSIASRNIPSATESLQTTISSREPAFPALTYAAKAVNGSSSQSVSPASVSKRSILTVDNAKSIYINENDQRVDRPLSNLNKGLVQTLKQRRLCNKFHLAKQCGYGNNCTHAHGPALSDVELENLRAVSRLKPCSYRLLCRQFDCIDGHRCQQGANCQNRSSGKCWFSDEMHTVEVHNVRKVLV